MTKTTEEMDELLSERFEEKLNWLRDKYEGFDSLLLETQKSIARNFNCPSLDQLNEPASKKAIRERLIALPDSVILRTPVDNIADEFHRLHVRLSALIEDVETAHMMKLRIHALEQQVKVLEDRFPTGPHQ